MQILKGQILKSVTVQHILDSTNSYCFVYYTDRLPFESYYLNSKVATLEELQEYLQEWIDDIKGRIDKLFDYDGSIYEYVIIYTNNTEEELHDLIEWLDFNETKFRCRCLLLTCKM